MGLDLGVLGDRFTINSVPRYLLGVSYFDGRNFKEEDLGKLKQLGFDLIRVWADWTASGDNGAQNASFFDSAGQIDAAAIQGLVRAAASHGLVVDVCINWAHPSYGEANIAAATHSAAEALKAESNVMLDVQNEHNNTDSQAVSLTHDELATLVTDIRGVYASVNRKPVVMYSSTHISDDDGNPVECMIQAELGSGVDLLTPHLARTPNWYSDTGRRVSAMKEAMQKAMPAGGPKPVYLQEENREGWTSGASTSGGEPTIALAEFLTAEGQAYAAGAAAWNFHTRAGFNLSGSNTFFGNIESGELGGAPTVEGPCLIQLGTRQLTRNPSAS